MDPSSMFDKEDVKEIYEIQNCGFPRLVYTSYFGVINKLPAEFEPIAICGAVPSWYNGKWMKKLAPSWSIWKEWHDSTAPDKNEQYVKRFIPERLGKLDLEKTIMEIIGMAGSKTPCLLCYEKPGDFCHRHLVAEWLNTSKLVKASEYNDTN